MTAPTNGRAPSTDVELVRSFHDRLRALETKRTVRVGPWVLTDDAATGALRATRPGQTMLIDGGSVAETRAESVNLSNLVTAGQLESALAGLGGGRITVLIRDLLELLDIEGPDLLNGVLDGIDLEPGAVMRMLRDMISEALEDRPLFGEIVEPITGRMQPGGGLADHFRNARELWGDGLDLNLDPGDFNPAEVLRDFMRDRVMPTDQFNNLLSLWGDALPNLNLDPGDFDPGSIIDQFIENRLRPTGKLATLVDGLLPDIHIPQLNVTKIDGVAGAANIGESVQQTIDNVVQAITNTAGSGFNFSDLFDGLKAQQDQIASINAGLAALQADQTGGNNNGVSASVSFSGVADTTDLAQFGFTKVQDSGTSVARVVTEALDMFYSEGAGSETWLYTDAPLESDYFEVSMVMPRAPKKPGLFEPSNDSYTELVGRSNASGSRRCVLRTYYNSVRVGTVVDGTYTQFGAYNNYNVPAGAFLTFRGGITGGIRTFQLLVNNQLKHTVTDTSNVSYVGESYRHCGWTLNTDGDYRPNNMSIWTMNDNAPVPTTGVGFFHAYRANTASTAQNNNSFAAFSSNTLDTVDSITSDMSWNASSQRLTVNTAGRYMVSMRELLADGPPSGNVHHCGVIYTSGGVTKNRHGDGWRGSSVSGGDGSSASIHNYNDMLGGMPIILNLNAGDSIRPAHNLDDSNGVIGDADGVETWFTVTKIG